MTMVMERQDMQLRLFGDRMLSINESAAQMMREERNTQEAVAGVPNRVVATRPPPEVPLVVANFEPDRIEN